MTLQCENIYSPNAQNFTVAAEMTLQSENIYSPNAQNITVAAGSHNERRFQAVVPIH